MPSFSSILHRAKSPVVIWIMLSALAGCSDSVDPTLGTEQPFTIFGYLDPAADTQAVRIIPISDRLDPDTEEQLDAEVYLVDMATNDSTRWRDSLTTFSDDRQGHIFWDPSPVRFGGTYQLVARRISDGATSSVTLTTPSRYSTPSVGLPIASFEDVVYPVTFPEAPYLLNATFSLRVTGHPDSPSDTTVFPIPLIDSDIENGTEGPRINLNFSASVREALERGGLENQLRLVDATLSGFVSTTDWAPPEFGFDPDLIIEPGTFSNVDNGFGFVGSGFFTSVRWIPSASAQLRAGLLSSGSVANQIAVNEVSRAENWIELYNRQLEPVSLAGFFLSDDLNNPNRRVALTGDAVVPGKDVLLIEDIPFALSAPSIVYLLSSSLEPIARLNVQPITEGTSYGPFPDGRAYNVRGSAYFIGPLQATPGAPNKRANPPVRINEIYAGADSSWVELIATPDYAGESFTVTHDVTQRACQSCGGAVFDENGFAVVEVPNSLFPRSGGEVLVFIPSRTLGRVVAFQDYSVQQPGTSSGLIPDGSETWVSGLSPSPGSPNSESP